MTYVDWLRQVMSDYLSNVHDDADAEARVQLEMAFTAGVSAANARIALDAVTAGPAGVVHGLKGIRGAIDAESNRIANTAAEIERRARH